jgi:hypothetical protein
MELHSCSFWNEATEQFAPTKLSRGGGLTPCRLWIDGDPDAFLGELEGMGLRFFDTAGKTLRAC